MEKIENSNARRFINAYNQIDYALRAQYNLKRSMNFSELIRKTVTLNYIVRKYEDELIDYGRLRNAIIHRSNEEYIIADPHDEVVLAIEKIAKLISTPPNALNTICKDRVITALWDDSLKKIIKIMSENSFTNIPLYKNGKLMGVIHGQRILEEIGKIIIKNENINSYIENTKINEIINEDNYPRYFVMPASSTIDDILELFFQNRKLLVVLITKNGSDDEMPLGIITTTELIEMNNILDNY